MDDPHPSEFRTRGALDRTMTHLRGILDRTDVRLGLVHKFLWDRYRSVRQDLYIQGMAVSNDDVISDMGVCNGRVFGVAWHGTTFTSRTWEVSGLVGWQMAMKTCHTVSLRFGAQILVFPGSIAGPFAGCICWRLSAYPPLVLHWPPTFWRRSTYPPHTVCISFAYHPHILCTSFAYP